MKHDNLLIHVNHGLTSGKVIHNCAVLCRKGKIFSIGGASAFDEANYNFKIDLPDSYVTPGFIDTHLYGFKGHNIMSDNAKEANDGGKARFDTCPLMYFSNAPSPTYISRRTIAQFGSFTERF